MESIVDGSKEGVQHPESLLRHKGYRIVERVYRAGLWKPGDENDRVQDEQAIISIAKEEIVRAPKVGAAPEMSLPPSDELEKRAQRAVDRFTSYSVLSGWLPEGAVVLARRITESSDIKISTGKELGGLGGINVPRGMAFERFPSQEERPDVIVGENAIKNRAALYSYVARKVGVDLTLEQSVEAAVYAVSVHEWSHSLETAFRTQYLTTALGLPEYDKNKDWYSVLGLAQDVIWNRVKNYSLVLVPGLNSMDEGDIHKERFSTGFELAALEFGLQEAGVSAEDASKIRAGVEERLREQLKEFKKLRSGLAIDDLDLQMLTGDLRRLLERNGLTDSRIPNLWAGIGYLEGYTREQLGRSTKEALSSLNQDTVKQEMFSYRGRQYYTF